MINEGSFLCLRITLSEKFGKKPLLWVFIKRFHSLPLQVQEVVGDLAEAEAAAGRLAAQLGALQSPEGAALAAALLARPQPGDPAAAAARALPASADEHALLVRARAPSSLQPGCAREPWDDTTCVVWNSSGGLNHLYDSMSAYRHFCPTTHNGQPRRTAHGEELAFTAHPETTGFYFEVESAVFGA